MPKKALFPVFHSFDFLEAGTARSGKSPDNIGGLGQHWKC